MYKVQHTSAQCVTEVVVAEGRWINGEDEYDGPVMGFVHGREPATRLLVGEKKLGWWTGDHLSVQEAVARFEAERVAAFAEAVAVWRKAQVAKQQERAIAAQLEPLLPAIVGWLEGQPYRSSFDTDLARELLERGRVVPGDMWEWQARKVLAGLIRSAYWDKKRPA